MMRTEQSAGKNRFGTWAVWGLLIGFPLLQILVAEPIIDWGRRDGGRGWLEFFGWLLVYEWALFAILRRDLSRRGLGLVDVGFPHFAKREKWILVGVTASFILFVIWVGDSSSPRIVNGPWVIPKLFEEKLLMIAVAWTAGICEETIFRGYLYHALRRMGRSVGAAVVITTASFVMIHGLHQPPTLFLFRIVAGLGLSALYLWRGSLKAPILVHVLVDAQLALST